MKNQFDSLRPWMGQILNTIKKDIRTEHLGSDPLFYKTYFANRPQNRLSTEEIFQAYEAELLKGNESLAEWVVNRWVFKHGDLYRHFAEHLARINPHFEQISGIDEKEAEEILKDAAPFGALNVYLFSVLNGVVFPASILERLRKAAEAEQTAEAKAERTAQEALTLEQTVARYEKEIARLNEKYENKIAGVQKKYTTDLEALKKQIRILQQRLHANA